MASESCINPPITHISKSKLLGYECLMAFPGYSGFRMAFPEAAEEARPLFLQI